jgi:ESCRT-II complex subunit VPS22
VSTADIQVAITKLAKLGGGFRTIEVGKSTMVVSVPTELDNDHMTVMSIANNFQDHGVKVVQVIELTGWTMDRAERSLKLLLQEGIAWLDTKEGIDYYWLPSIWQECTSQTFAKEFI